MPNPFLEYDPTETPPESSPQRIQELLQQYGHHLPTDVFNELRRDTHNLEEQLAAAQTRWRLMLDAREEESNRAERAEEQLEAAQTALRDISRHLPSDDPAMEDWGEQSYYAVQAIADAALGSNPAGSPDSVEQHKVTPEDEDRVVKAALEREDSAPAKQPYVYSGDVNDPGPHPAKERP